MVSVAGVLLCCVGNDDPGLECGTRAESRRGRERGGFGGVVLLI